MSTASRRLAVLVTLAATSASLGACRDLFERQEAAPAAPSSTAPNTLPPAATATTTPTAQAAAPTATAPTTPSSATPPSAAAVAAATDGGTVAPTPSGPFPGSPSSFAPLVQRVRTSVVSIFTAHVEQRGMQYGFMNPSDRISRGLGTGFLINTNGEILTNNHVIEDAQLIEVQLDDGRRFPASVVGRDPRVDVALLRLKAPGVEVQPAPLGNSDGLEVGDWVMAIGNPFGLSQTVTVGIVSAKGRTGRDVPLDPAGYYSFIQTDASINPGNSGGPLLNLSGEVVGINTAVNRSGQGIGFAIPMNMISTILPQLRQYGRVMRSWMGLSIREIDESTSNALNLADRHGALVIDVDPTGPAAQAGVRPGDIIRRFDEHTLGNSSELPWLASTAGVGHRARIQLRRGSEDVEVEMTLAAMPELQVQPGMQPGMRPGMMPPGSMRPGFMPPGYP
jgi:serine protease Do